MITRFFTDKDFLPGEVKWDTFEVDVDKPLPPQLDDYCEDITWVTFTNGCSLIIDTFSPYASHEHRRLVISLSQVAAGNEYEVFERRECKSIEELRSAVSDFIEIAVRRPSIPTYVLREGEIGDAILLNNLLLDQTLSPEEQVNKLGGTYFDASYGGDLSIVISWEPARDSNGEFVIRLLKYTATLEERVASYDAGPIARHELIAERRCRSFPELKRLARELDTQARAMESK